MLQFHHVNLGVQPGGIPAMHSFLGGALGYRRVNPGADLAAMGVNWFEAEDGSQIHLSEDPDHRPAARAHVAIVLGDAFEPVIARLEAAGHDVKVSEGLASAGRVGFCQDPGGNRWELREH